MNRLRIPLGVALLGIGTALVLALPAFAQQKPAQVKITDTRVEIHPGAKISQSDQKALNEVLSKYNQSLYKIKTVKDDGKVTVQGRLEDKHVDTKLAAEAKQTNVAGASVQVVDHKYVQPPPGGIIVVQQAKSKELIEAIKPILQKYSKKQQPR